ncbi:MAG: hypothetical protein H6829_05320 [Planctomycetes bacterium]|nr:hypothetical protein [Planctomycetota bacterium]
MAEEFGDDLGILLVESQGATPEEAEKFCWGKKWMGNGAMWTTERPFDTGAPGLPNFVLLSNTGEVLLMGNPLAMHGAIHDAISAEIEKAQSPPEGSPKSLAKAWKALQHGDYDKAILEARKVAEKGGEDAEDATATATLFVAKVQAQLDRVEWMLANAYLVEAQELLESLSKATKGIDDFQAKTTELAAKFDSEEMKAEMEAAKAFAKIEEKLKEDGLDDKLIKRLAKFVKANPDAKVTGRAERLVSFGE